MGYGVQHADVRRAAMIGHPECCERESVRYAVQYADVRCASRIGHPECCEGEGVLRGMKCSAQTADLGMLVTRD